jgi:hypothetical protein
MPYIFSLIILNIKLTVWLQLKFWIADLCFRNVQKIGYGGVYASALVENNSFIYQFEI